MRGRLMQRFMATIYRVDPEASAEVVGGGYDDNFRELLPVDDGTQMGAPSRREMAAIEIPCQVDRSLRVYGDDRMTRAGHEILENIELTCHWRDLERLGLLDTNGNPMLYQGDRIDRLTTLAGAVEEVFPNPPGMVVVEAEKAGYGLAAFGTPRFNLLILHCRFQKQTWVAGQEQVEE